MSLPSTHCTSETQSAFLMGIHNRSESHMYSTHGSHVGGIHRCHGHSRPCKDNTGTKGHGATLLFYLEA